MRRFWLNRRSDPTGVSGTGLVAEGVIFSDGSCALHWLTAISSTGVYADLEAIRRIHGHDGATEILLENGDLDEPLAPHLAEESS